MYPQIGWFLPENFIFWLLVSELIKTNILSYHILKSLCKQKNYSFQKISKNLTLKNHCQLFYTYIHLFSFSEVSILYGEYGIKREVYYLWRKYSFSKFLKGPYFSKIFYHGERHRKMSWGHFCWYFLFIHDLILSIQAKLRYLKDFKFSRVLELKVIFFKFWSFGEGIYFFVFFS